MTIIRLYEMIAIDGQSEMLAAALRDLSDAVLAIAGSEETELMRDAARPERIIFIERWASVEAHSASGPLLPRPLLDAVMAFLAEKPVINQFLRL